LRRLLACQECHTQYDVTDVAAESFPCRCGETVRNERLQAVDAVILRCGSCGAQLTSDARACSFCGSEIVRDDSKLSLICPECHGRNADASRFCTACGVAFEPEPVKIEGYELPCPVCGVLMAARSIGGIGINECATCNGIWAPEGRLDLLINRAIEARKSGEKLQSHVPRVKGGNPASQGVAYRKCPECEAFMQRRNFRRASGVIVDICKKHGTWLDADELEQVTGFVLSGGNPGAEKMMEEADRQAAQAARNIRIASAISESGWRSHQPSSGDLLSRTLVGVLRKFLE
jgi:Zn-finger nucleic acid-binding protein